VLPDFRESFAFLEVYHISMLIKSKDIYKIYGFNSALLRKGNQHILTEKNILQARQRNKTQRNIATCSCN
jgi:hypothetical protein